MTNNQKEKQQDKNINRRRFFTVIGNSAIGVATAASLGITYDYLSPNVLLEIPKRFKVGPLSTIQPNSVVFKPEYQVFIFRELEGYLYAVSAICPHLGCASNWIANGISGHPEGVITCPCHGSVFSKTGNVIRGPVSRSLDRFRIYLEDGNIIVDTEEIVSEEEMILKV